MPGDNLPIWSYDPGPSPQVGVLPAKHERSAWEIMVIIFLSIIAGLLGSIYYEVHNQGTPVIVRQCITIDAPKGTTKVGCD